MNSYIPKKSKQQKQRFRQQGQKTYRTVLRTMETPHHAYHLVDPSPWPA
jgi:hypothetical protein